MEGEIEFEQKNLMNKELKQGQELANQLKQHFLDTTKTSSQTCDFLLTNILSSYENALSMLKSNASKFEDHSPLISPHSFTSTDDTTSPTSEISTDQPHKNVFKKRKALPQWSEQVQVPLGAGVEGPLVDGYSWRKYGQKDILGATFPRAYYRCTYRHSQGCLATKQVQKSDEDSSLIQVTYKGRHTCKQGSELTAGLVSFGTEEKRQKKVSHEPKQEGKIQKQEVEKIISFGTSLKIEELGTSMEMERLPSFSFPSAIIESVNKKDQLFFEDTRENSFLGGSYSSSFITPETSECSYLSVTPYHMDNFGIARNLQSSESDFTEILSAPNSVTNSPVGDFDISLDPVDFDPNFPLDILEFFN